MNDQVPNQAENSDILAINATQYGWAGQIFGEGEFMMQTFTNKLQPVILTKRMNPEQMKFQIPFAGGLYWFRAYVAREHQWRAGKAASAKRK